MESKKGLSDVVTTVLIILLVLAAVVIVWAFVRPAIQSGAGQVSGACVNLDLKVVSCDNEHNAGVSTGFSNITVERGADEVDLQQIVLVFDLVNGDTQVNKTGQSLGALGRSTFTNFNVASEASQVTVTGEVRTEAGEIKLCQPTAVKVDC